MIALVVLRFHRVRRKCHRQLSRDSVPKALSVGKRSGILHPALLLKSTSLMQKMSIMQFGVMNLFVGLAVKGIENPKSC